MGIFHDDNIILKYHRMIHSCNNLDIAWQELIVPTVMEIATARETCLCR